MNTRDAELLAMAKAFAVHSTDRSRTVGCVIATRNGEVLTAGYNAFPAGVDVTVEARHDRPAKYLWTEHAERNAIYSAAKQGIALAGSTAYVPWFPCMDCARALIQSGVVRLVAYSPDFEDTKWGDEFRSVVTMLSEGGVQVEYAEGKMQ